MKKSKKIVTFLESEEQQPEYSTADGETEHRHTLTWDDGVLKSHGPADEGEKHEHDIKERSDGSYFLDKGGKDGHTHEAPESINQSESEEEDLMITPPFKKGVKDKEKGKLINDNPYEQGSKEAIDWADGWASMLSGSSLRPFQLRPANDDGQPTGKGFDKKVEGNEMNRTSKLINRIKMLEASFNPVGDILKQLGPEAVKAVKIGLEGATPVFMIEDDQPKIAKLKPGKGLGSTGSQSFSKVVVDGVPAVLTKGEVAALFVDKRNASKIKSFVQGGEPESDSKDKKKPDPKDKDKKGKEEPKNTLKKDELPW